MAEGTTPVSLRSYGNCAFQWTSPSGVRVLIDPYHNQEGSHWFLRPFPPLPTDVVLVTHAHFDHDAVDVLPGAPTTLREAGRTTVSDVTIHGVADLHSRSDGMPEMQNVIFVIEAGGIRYCHIGDNRADIPEEVRKAIGAVDVLMVTVDDSCHLLSYEEVDGLVRRLNPRVVVPTHYYIEGFNSTRCDLEPPDKWLATQARVRRLEPGALDLTPSQLPASREVWVMAQ